MLHILGRRQTVCDGLTRRYLIQAGGAGLLGLSLPKVLQAEVAPFFSGGRAKFVIFLHLFGGPSQLETFDMKPDAPADIRGPFKPIASRTPGLQICEHLGRTAQVSDKMCVVRSMTHQYNDHSGAGHYLQTGRPWHIPIGGGFNATPKDWPSMGSVVEHLGQRVPGWLTRDLPNYAVVPNSLGRLQEFAYRLVRPGEYAGWLGKGYDPLTTAIEKRDAQDDPYYRNYTDEELTFEIEGLVKNTGLTLTRMNARKLLLEQFSAAQHVVDGNRAVAEYDQFQQRALALVASEKTRQALDIRRESDKLRDNYGRHLFGQSTLIARRLVEAGVRFVTVQWDSPTGYGWDSHVNSKDLLDNLLPKFDQSLSALLTDLDERGLLDETLVVALGEMGRTPKPTPSWGRGHWSTLFPAVLAGAGIRGGVTYGTSDNDAAYPVERASSPEDLAATIYYALGIDPELQLKDAQGRQSSKAAACCMNCSVEFCVAI